MILNDPGKLQDGRMIPVLVLGFWDKNIVICAGAMPGFSGDNQDLGFSSLKRGDGVGGRTMRNVGFSMMPSTQHSENRKK